jgi:hypothetical protein
MTVALAATVAIAAATDLQPTRRITPQAAVAAIRDAAASRVLNDYDFGGFLIFSGVPPFIDGRTELYGSAFTVRQHRAVTLGNLDDFVALLDEYAVAATLLAPTTPAVALLDRLPGWQRRYADDVAVVHIRAAR